MIKEQKNIWCVVYNTKNELRVIMKKFFTIILIASFTFLAAACGEKGNMENTESANEAAAGEDNAVIVEKRETYEPEDLVSKKAADEGVVVRSGYVNSYNIKTHEELDNRYLAEEVLYDRDGNVLEHNKYKRDKSFISRWVFEYNEDGKIKHNQTIDDYGQVIYDRTTVFDEEGRDKEWKVITQQKESNLDYFFYYNDETGLLDSLISKAPDGRYSAITTYEYDKYGRKTKEFTTMAGVGRDTLNYGYDEDDKLITTDNKKGMTVKYVYEGEKLMEEILNAPMFAKPHKYVYTYYDNGLMKTKTRYGADGNPAYKITYEYEYYD